VCQRECESDKQVFVNSVLYDDYARASWHVPITLKPHGRAVPPCAKEEPPMNRTLLAVALTSGPPGDTCSPAPQGGRPKDGESDGAGGGRKPAIVRCK
jgi:hypothetical protein